MDWMQDMGMVVWIGVVETGSNATKERKVGERIRDSG